MVNKIKELEDLSKYSKVIEEILKNSGKEVVMWRLRYLESGYISHNREEKRFIRDLLLSSPAGIEDIDDFVYNALVSYRDK